MIRGGVKSYSVNKYEEVKGKEKGKQNHLLYDIETVGKNIKWRKGMEM